MGFLTEYNQKNGIETPTSTGTGFLQQYNSQPHPTTTPIAKPKATTPVKITQPQTQTPAKPGLLQQAENFIAPVIKTVEKAPIIGKPLQEAVATAKEVVKETPAIIKAVKTDAKSTVKHPVETAAGFTLGVGKALTDFSISTQKTINNIKNGIDTAAYNAVGYKPPKNWDPRENRDNMVKILEGFQKTRDQNFSIMGKDTNRGIAIGNFIGSFIPYAVAAEAATIAVGSALTTPTIAKFAPNAVKLAPAIGNAVSFLGLGQLTFDKTVDKSRVEKAKNDLIMLGLFETGGYLAKELSSGTKNLISKVFNSASKEIKSPKGADLNMLETQINEVKDAVKKDTGKNAETVLARNMANASDNEIKLLTAPKEQYISGEGFKMTDKANPQKVEVMKSINDYQTKLDKYNQNPTSQNLKLVQDARQTMVDLKNQKLVVSTKNVEKTSTPISLQENKPITTTASTETNPVIKPTEVKVPREQLPIKSKGQENISRLEARVTQSLNKTPEQIKSQLGETYTQMSKPEQIAKATKFVTDNPDEALSILRGEKSAPEGLLKNSIYVAMENQAVGDVELARKLASLASTRAGQELSILTEINPNSPVKHIREVVNIRQQAIEKKLGKPVSQAIKDETARIRAKVKLPNRQEWADFISSIQC